METGSQTKEEVLACDAARAGFYRFLASLMLYELTEEQVKAFASAVFPAEGDPISQGYSLMQGYLNSAGVDARQRLAVDYAHTFLNAGNYTRLMAPPYESVFTSKHHILMQDSRDGAVAFYREEGLSLPKDGTTPEDHAGFEMQFMATLIERADEALRDGKSSRFNKLVGKQEAFFQSHLANWLPLLAHAIETHCETDFYRGVALLLNSLVEQEKEVLSGLMEMAGAEAREARDAILEKTRPEPLEIEDE